MPKKKSVPTVKRGAGGRIESLRTPIAPLGDAPVVSKPDPKYATPAKPKSKRTKTRTGKKLDKATGKVAPEEARTELPTAGRDVMEPKQTPQPVQPFGTLKRGGERRFRGFGIPHKNVKAAVDAAMHHLGNMQATKGQPEFDDHVKTFDAIHGNIKGMDSGIHLLLGQAKHQITTGGPQSKPILGRIQGLITSRLAEGKQAEIENKQRAQEGRQRKQGGN
jgi:hypothetical protein